MVYRKTIIMTEQVLAVFITYQDDMKNSLMKLMIYGSMSQN